MSGDVEFDQEAIGRQWPGFTVTCNKCGSARALLKNDLRCYPETGMFGEVTLSCLVCNNNAEIVTVD